MFDFQSYAMRTEASASFREAVAAFCGCTGESYESLLSSLPSELCYNDMRDAGRRHAKCEKTDATNLHAIALKSCLRRPSGCKTVELATEDWQAPLKGKSIKARVHHSLKPTDVDLGISCEGLTRHKTNKQLKKPHVFHQRLRLLKVLQRRWECAPVDEDEKHENLLSAYKLLWTSRLVPRGCFMQWASRPSEENRQLVLTAGPHAVQLLPLKLMGHGQADCELFDLEQRTVPRRMVEAGPIDNIQVALTQVTLSGTQMAWKQTSPWMSLQEYVADHSILEIGASLLSSLCSAMKIKGHSKLSHKKRVEAFLREMGRSEDYVNEILDELPERKPRVQKEAPLLHASVF